MKFDSTAAGQANGPEASESNPSAEISASRYQGNDEGGFGNPPVNGQFRKGGKGGPGRNKGEASLESALRKITTKKIPVNKDGKRRNLSPADILAERTLEAMLAKNPSPRMLELAHKIFAKYGPKEVEKIKFDFSRLSLVEKKIYRAVLGGVLSPNKDATAKRELEIDCAGIYRIYQRDDGDVGFEKLTEEITDNSEV
jgi:hypothetical protein